MDTSTREHKMTLYDEQPLSNLSVKVLQSNNESTQYKSSKQGSSTSQLQSLVQTFGTAIQPTKED